LAPSDQPTLEPTHQPTDVPTLQPSDQPTFAPTPPGFPTEAPSSNAPTKEPTVFVVVVGNAPTEKPTKSPTTFVKVAKSGGGDNNSAASIPVLVGIIIASLLFCLLCVSAVIWRRERDQKKDCEDVISNPAHNLMGAYNFDNKTMGAVHTEVPLAALTKRGDRLWEDFRRVVSFDHQYFGNDLLALDDKQLQDAYAILAVACPTESFFGPLRQVGARFCAQEITDPDKDEAILDDLVDFLAKAMPDVLMERAIDVLAMGGDASDMFDGYAPEKNPFLYDRGGCREMVYDAAHRELIEIDPVYCESSHLQPDSPYGLAGSGGPADYGRAGNFADGDVYAMADSSMEGNVYARAHGANGGGNYDMARGGKAAADYEMARAVHGANYDVATMGGAHAHYDVGTNVGAHAVYETAAAGGIDTPYGMAGGDVNATYGMAGKTNVVYEVAGAAMGETDDADYGLADRGGDFGNEPHYALGGGGGLADDERDYEAATGAIRPASYETAGGAAPHAKYDTAADGQAAINPAAYETGSGSAVGANYDVAQAGSVLTPAAYETGSGAAVGATYDVAQNGSVITPAAYDASGAAVGATYDVAEAGGGVIIPAEYEAGNGAAAARPTAKYEVASGAGADGGINPATYTAGATYDEASGVITPAAYEAGATYDEANGVSVITPATYEPGDDATPASYDAAVATATVRPAKYDAAAAAATAAIVSPAKYDAAAASAHNYEMGKSATVTSVDMQAMSADFGDIEADLKRDYELGQMEPDAASVLPEGYVETEQSAPAADESAMADALAFIQQEKTRSEADLASDQGSDADLDE
jgi:hypothetical protein